MTDLPEDNIPSIICLLTLRFAYSAQLPNEAEILHFLKPTAEVLYHTGASTFTRFSHEVSFDVDGFPTIDIYAAIIYINMNILHECDAEVPNASECKEGRM